MDLRKENYSLKGLFLSICWLVFTTIYGQSDCMVRVAFEPLKTSEKKTASVVTQSDFSYYTSWQDIDKSLVADNVNTSAIFTKQGLSNVLKFNNFGFNIPEGSTIHGIKLKVNGRSEGQGNIQDYLIKLSNGNNKTGKGYNSKNVWAKGSLNKTFYYGYEDDNWGAFWNTSAINASNFGLEIQVMNSQSKPVTAYLDNVELEIFYTPLATYCLTDCFPVYVDPIDGAASYLWHFPDGFEMISKSEKHNVIDFKVMKATPGIHNVCIDVLDANGNLIDNCCRNIRLRNCTPATLGNFVWNDINYNGIQDANEPGIANVKVDLFTQNNVLVQTKNTDGQGKYTFNNINEGSYYVAVTLPSNYLISRSGNTTEDKDNDFLSQTSNRSAVQFIAYGTNSTDLDFGLVKKLTIGNFVWEDLNYNGIQEVNEKGIADVKIYLLTEAGVIIDSTSSNGLGSYLFQNLPADKYQLRFVSPQSYKATKLNIGLTTTDSDVKINGETSLINFQNTENNQTIDAGFFRFASIGDFVWEDVNKNGLQDADEAGTAGIKIYIFNGSNQLNDSTTSDENGKYIFNNLTPGQYYLQPVLSLDAFATIVVAGNLGSDLKNISGVLRTDLFTLLSNDQISDIDLGYQVGRSVISGLVWTDENNDGQYVNTETLLVNQWVYLLNASGVKLDSILTDGNGAYSFDNLPNGTYKIGTFINENNQYTDANKGSDDSDSDVLNRIDFGQTDDITFTTSDTASNVFIGITKRSTVGDYIWNDNNYNGLQDAGESGIADVVIKLLDENGLVIKTTISGTDGFYGFSNMVTGQYQLEIEIPILYLVTKQNNTDLNVNNDLSLNGQSELFTVPLGQDKLDIDGGLIKKLSIGDFVWEDDNGNGIQDIGESGVEGVVINLFDESGTLITSTTSSGIGQYGFNDLPAIKYLLEVVASPEFIPTKLNQGNATNDNNLKQDFTTDVIDFTNVNLDNTIDFGLVRNACIGDFAWVDSNEDGSFNTGDLVLEDVLINLFNENGQLIKISITDSLGKYEMCGLPPGNYYLEVIPNSAYIPTIKGSGSVLKEGQVLPFYTDTFAINSGDVLNDIDLGFLYRPKSKICGFVWFDADADGINASTELKLQDYEVGLYDGNKNLINQTSTNEDGDYCFLDLSPADYYVQFFIRDTQQFTFPNIGTDDLDSDAEGLADSAFSELITIVGASDQMSVSAGITARAAIGDFVWFDTNKDGLQGITELGIPGIRVDLKDGSGSLINFTTTGIGGKYQFDNLVRGNYSLQFAALPSLDFTLKNIDAVLGSDVNIDGSTDVFVLSPNEDNFDLDAGFALKGAGIGGLVWQDVNKDTLRNQGDVLLEGIIVKLYNEGGALISTDTTNTKGEYVFFPVPGGNYYVVFDTLPYLSYQLADVLLIENDVTHIKQRGSTDVFTLIDGNVLGGIDCGMFDIRSTVQGVAFDDRNGDGILSNIEAGINEIWVYLLKDTTAIDSVLTDSEGRYLFEEIMPGNYQILFDTIGSNFIFGLQHVGQDSLFDSDVNGLGLTDTLNVGMCQMIMGINAAYRGFGNVQGIMFNDVNENGLNDDNVEGINNVHICILDLDNNILRIDTTSTVNGISGVYAFDNMLAGAYKIKVRRPLFYIFTEKDVNGNANDGIDSDVFAMGSFDALSDNFILEAEDNLTVDGGLIFSVPMDSKISGVVWKESVYNGLREANEAPVADIEMILYNDVDVEIKRTTSNANGFYEFTGLSEGYYYVKAILDDTLTTALYHQSSNETINNDFFDGNVIDATDIFYLGISQDTSNVDLGIAEEISIGDFVWSDTNDNGLQDVGEAGLAGVGVVLRLSNNEVYDNTITNANGNYEFANLPRGSYFLEFKLLDGYSAARKQTGDVNTDSDVNDNGFTDLLVLVGESNAIDAGFVKNGSIGNRIWVDLNSNGIQDNGEPGLNGATLKLFDEDDNFIAETSSSSTQGGIEGIYNFFNVRPGNYYVQITGPLGYVITRFNIGAAAVNSDLQMDGFTGIFTVLPDEMKEDIDAGFYLPACIGDRVWVDENQNGIQDEGELGLEGVQVILLRSNGQALDTLITDAEGKYLFAGLTQGLYSLKFDIENPPYKATIRDEGEDNLDSDIDSLGNTALISLAHGAKFLDLDAGVYVSNVNQLILSDVEGNEIQNLEAEVSVYPNPALNDIEIKVGQENSTISIFNMNGQLMKLIKSGKAIYRLNIQEFPAGKYYVFCKNGAGIQQTSFNKFD